MKLACISLFAALALSACQQPGETAPEAKPGSVLSEGRLVLPAVKGNPGAAYFTYSNKADAAVTIATVSIAGAGRAEMHASEGGKMTALPTLAVPDGETVRFAPGGKHVMVFGIAPSIVSGGTAELTVTFADGDQRSAPLKVEAAGGQIDMEH